MSEFKIEKGIPMVRLLCRRGTGVGAAIMAMEIGDSVLDPAPNPITRKNTWYVEARRHGRRVSIASVEGGLRVWRTA